jgi:hypothetical protein
LKTTTRARRRSIGESCEGASGIIRSTSASQPLARRETPAMCRPPRLARRLPGIGAGRNDLDDPGVSVIQTPHMEASERRIRSEVERRRTFAIISHPDAGKTTLTEKLLLFGGALREAGAVRAQRAARHATSDWLSRELADPAPSRPRIRLSPPAERMFPAALSGKHPTRRDTRLQQGPIVP